MENNREKEMSEEERRQIIEANKEMWRKLGVEFTEAGDPPPEPRRATVWDDSSDEQLKETAKILHREMGLPEPDEEELAALVNELRGSI